MKNEERVARARKIVCFDDPLPTQRLSLSNLYMSTDILLPPDGAHKKAATTYKILIIGDSNVGKTSLLNRYCDDSFPSSTLIATVGKKASLEDEICVMYRVVFLV